jgi:hypothetical protein
MYDYLLEYVEGKKTNISIQGDARKGTKGIDWVGSRQMEG